MSEQEITISQEPEFDVNEVQAALTASRVLVAILETIGEVKVPTKTVFEATSKKKELLVDYDESGPAFVFRLPKEEEMTYPEDTNEETVSGE